MDKITAWDNWMLAAGFTEATRSCRLTAIRQFERQTGVAVWEADSHTVAQWLSERPSSTTRATYYSHLKSLVTYLITTGQISDNPLNGITRAKEPVRQPRPIQKRDLYRVLRGQLTDRERAAIVLGAHAGLRIGETARVRTSDFNLELGTLTVKGKGGDVVTVPVHQDVLAQVEYMPAKSWWFQSRDYQDRHLLGVTVAGIVKRVFSGYGIKMTSHQLRHYFATHLLESGVDIRVVQTLMRHRSINSTMLYTYVSNSQQRRALAAMQSLPSRQYPFK